MGSTAYHYAEELETDPPARLTMAGRAMLEEIWIAAGRPAKPKAKPNGDDGTHELTVPVEKLASHTGPEAKRRSSARIRAQLLDGGYLHVSEYKTEEDEDADHPGRIDELGLSAKAFDALIAAGKM